MKKSRLKLWVFICHNINVTLLWVIIKRYTILEDFFLRNSVRYRGDVMTKLKFHWSNLKILMSGWYRKLTSLCVSFTIYQQCHADIEDDVTPLSLQYQNVRRVIVWYVSHSNNTVESCSVEHARRKKYLFPANFYLFKVNKRNSRKRCEIYSKLTIKTPEQRQLR